MGEQAFTSRVERSVLDDDACPVLAVGWIRLSLLTGTVISSLISLLHEPSGWSCNFPFLSLLTVDIPGSLREGGVVVAMAMKLMGPFEQGRLFRPMTQEEERATSPASVCPGHGEDVRGQERSSC